MITDGEGRIVAVNEAGVPRIYGDLVELAGTDHAVLHAGASGQPAMVLTDRVNGADGPVARSAVPFGAAVAAASRAATLSW